MISDVVNWLVSLSPAGVLDKAVALVDFILREWHHQPFLQIIRVLIHIPEYAITLREIEDFILKTSRFYLTAVLVIAKPGSCAAHPFVLSVLNHSESCQAVKFLSHPIGALASDHVDIAGIGHSELAGAFTKYFLYEVLLVVLEVECCIAADDSLQSDT